MISGSGNDVAPPGELLLIALGIGPGGFVRPGWSLSVAFVEPASWSSSRPARWSIVGRARRVLSWCSDRELERPLDVLARARVDLDVGRQVLDRVLVAGDRVDLVDPAVVPVVQQRLPARRDRHGPRDSRRRREREQQRAGTGAEKGAKCVLERGVTKEGSGGGQSGSTRVFRDAVCAGGSDPVRRLLSPLRRLRSMLLSRRMAVTRQLLSPLGAALALVGAALFFGGGSGSGSLPWLGGAAVAVAVALASRSEVPQRLVALLPLAALAVWCAASVAWSIEPDRSWDYANRTFVYLAFALVGAYLAGRTGELALGLAALLGAVCVWALAGKVLPVALRGLRPHRAPARAGRLLERARAARRHRAAARALARRAHAEPPERSSSTAGSSRSRSPTRAAASSSRSSSSRRGSRSRAPGSPERPRSSPRASRRRS